ncbi:hypothetical protein GOBAR_DD05686 [Gossypium barbadense]|nr:hypothetical protein GOBAR_DD05686 [Gossypium barbadense]
MELVDDEDVKTMVVLYCGTQSNQNTPIQLFAELAGMEATEDPTPLGEEDGVQEPCMVVPVSYVDSQSTIHGINIDLNVAPETDVFGDDVYYSNDPVEHEVDSESDPDVDEVSGDIDDEGVKEDGNVNASSVGNQIRGIMIHNNPEAHMSRIDPDAARVAEFSEYPEIQPAHRMAIYSDPEELFVGQRFESKEECIFAIKRYSMNILVDYKIVVSKPTLYIGECWRSAEGCNWRIRFAFIQKSQMWEIRKFVGPHTCTSTRMIEDHRKIDAKTICTCIMPMVKDMPTIEVSVLISKIQARFQYQVSYRKACIAKQMAIEQLYGDFDASYNELQGWIAAMKEHILLLAVAQDGNRNVLPIAFFIVDKENMKSWEFFLTNLRRMSQQQVNQVKAGHVFVEDVRDAMVANRQMVRSITVEVYSRRNETFRVTETIGRRPGIPPRSYGVDLRNRRCDCTRFQTLHYPCAHVVAACAKVGLNVELFIDEVYTIERTLRV